MGPMARGDGPRDHGAALGLDAALVALRASGAGVWVWDAADGVVNWDDRMGALCGLAPGEFGGSFEAWLATVHPDDAPHVQAAVADAMERLAPYSFEYRTVWPDGTERWLECRGEVTTDASGAATGTVGCAFDVTGRRQAARRVERLQRVTQALSAAESVEDVVAGLMDSLQPPSGTTALGLWCTTDDGAALELTAQRGMRSRAAELFARIELDSSLPGAVACRERRTIISPSQHDSVDRFPELRGAPRTSQGFIVVPMRAEGDVLGVVTLGYDGPLEEEEVVFLEAAAAHAAQTLVRVRLAESLAAQAEEAADVARRERRRREYFEFLLTLTQAAVNAADHRELMRAVASAAVPALGDWASVHFVPEEGATVERVVAHADPARASWATVLEGHFPADPAGERGVARVLRTGQTEFVPVVSAEVAGEGLARPGVGRLDDELRAEAGQLASVITVGLVSDGRTVGALQLLNTTSGRHHEPVDVELAETVAGRISDALVRLWRSEQHRLIASSLQQAFLPPRLPEVPGFDLAARYWPASASADVGGDFYDVFQIEPTVWAVVIGDVCGTGPDAAAVAAIARHTARAAARHGHDHATVLDWVNHAVRHSDRGLFCTMSYATIDAAPGADRVVRAASAGHPRPMHCRKGGATRIGEPGTLLGVFDQIKVSVARAVVRPGEVLVFYTDGMTDLPPPYGLDDAQALELVASAAERGAAADVVDVLRGDVRRRTPPGSHRDDVALVVACCLPAPVDGSAGSAARTTTVRIPSRGADAPDEPAAPTTVASAPGSGA